MRLHAVRADAGGAGAVGVDPEGVRGPRRWRSRCAYVFMQVGRSLFMLWALKRHDAGNYRNFQRIIGLARAGGGVLDRRRVRRQPARGSALWALALGDRIRRRRRSYFWVPGLGRSTTADWKVEGGHMAERCGAVHHHRARRIDPDHRRDLRRADLDRRARRAPSSWRSPAASRCGRSTSTSAPSARSQPDRVLRRSRPAGAQRLHLHAPADRRRHHRRGGRPTSWCCTIRAAPHRRHDRRRDPRRAGALSRSATRCSSACRRPTCRCRTWSGSACWRC